MADKQGLFSKLIRMRPIQFKSMNVVVWPIGTPGYEFSNPQPEADYAAAHLCPEGEYLEALASEYGYHISDEVWEEGHFDRKFGELQTAICGFVDGHLGHVIWAAIGPLAGERLVFDPPLKLDWTRSCILSGAYTPPEFRGRGLYPFVMNEALKMLLADGITNVYGSFHYKNIPSQKGLQKAHALHAATCFRARLMVPGCTTRYVPWLTYGYKPNSRGRWFRRQLSDQMKIQPVPLE